MENVRYIPGDLVKLNRKLKVVKRAEPFDFRVSDIDGTHVTLCTAKEVEPIPLTPQILEANGWEKVHQEPVNCCNKYKKFRNVDLTYNIQTKTFFFEIFNIAGAVVVRLPYVHTLQHFLFGLGLPSELKV